MALASVGFDVMGVKYAYREIFPIMDYVLWTLIFSEFYSPAHFYKTVYS